MEYGIGVKNRYELFYDEDGDPLELIAKQEEERKKAQAERKSKAAIEAATKTVQKPAGNQAPSKTIASKENGSIKTSQPAGQRNKDNRVNRDSSNVERRPKENDRSSDERRRRNPENQDGKDKKVNGRDNRGTRAPKRREGGGERDKKNERNPMKTASPPNGATKEEIEKTSESPVPIDENAEEKPVQPNDTKEEEPTQEELAEAEATEKTLEQWKKEMEAKKSKASYDANIRKPNEGEAGLGWDKMKVIKKKKDATTPTQPLAATKPNQLEDLDEEDRKLKRLEETLSKQFHFSDNRGNSGNSGSGNRSGRRGGSGTGGSRNVRGSTGSNRTGTDYRGGDQKSSRGNRAHNGHVTNTPKNPTPRVEDLNDFPSLAA